MQVEKEGGFWIHFRQEIRRVANSLNYVGERKGEIKARFMFLAEVNVYLEVLSTKMALTGKEIVLRRRGGKDVILDTPRLRCL